MKSHLSVKQLTAPRDFRSQTRERISSNRHNQRLQRIIRKRIQPESEELVELIGDYETASSHVEDLVIKLGRNTGDIKGHLRSLRKILSSRPDLVDSFYSVENSVRSLVSHLTSRDGDLHVEAAWLVSSIAAAEHGRILTLVKLSAPYLITYLGGSHTTLQKHCIFALGNMAGDTEKARKMLRSQGAIPALARHFTTSQPEILQAVAFALTNFTQDSTAETLALLELGVGNQIIKVLKETSQVGVLKEMAWLLFHLAYEPDVMKALVNTELIEGLASCFCNETKERNLDTAIRTPLIRTLANISGFSEDWCLLIAEFPGLTQNLLLQCQSTKPHARKEAFWLLSNLLASEKVVQRLPKYAISYNEMFDNNLKFGVPEDCKKQVLRCLCNLVAFNEIPFAAEEQEAILNGVLAVIPYSDTSIKHLCLQFLFSMCAKNLGTMDTVFIDLISANVQPLLYHNDEIIRTLAHEVIRTIRLEDSEMCS